MARIQAPSENALAEKQTLSILESVKSNELEALVVNALAYLKQGSTLLGFMRADRAVRIQADQAGLCLLKGRCLEAMGCLHEAMAAFRESLKRSPSFPPALRALLALSKKGVVLPTQTLRQTVQRLLKTSDADADILLASSVLWQHTRQLPGAVNLKNGTVTGWVAAQPNQRVVLGLKDGNHPCGAISIEATNDRDAGELLIRRFTFDWPQGVASLSVFYQGDTLLNSPLIREQIDTPNAVESKQKKKRDKQHSDPCIDIIIPVYKNIALTQACITSVLAARNQSAHEIIVIDDATPEPELAHWLDHLAEQHLITLLRNPINRGFILSVNRGVSLHTGRDVVLLNADTQVTGDWLDRLRATAYRELNVASVTPFSNNGEHFGFPVPFKVSPMPQGAALARLQSVASKVNHQRSIEVPFGIGFCLYLRRACLEQIGYLDEAELTRGYGEEVELCLRASAAGWQHRCALDVFVAHKGNVSFGEEKTTLVESNNRLIRRRHPHARRLYRDFIENDPLLTYRKAIEKALISQDQPPCSLVIIDSQKYNSLHWRSQWAAYAIQAQAAIFLQPCVCESGNYRIIGIRSDSPQNLVYDLPSEMPELVHDLVALNVQQIHYHDTANQRPEILKLPDQLGKPYEIHPHDYALYCPRRYLINGTGQYCGDQIDAGVCARCVGTYGDLLAHPSAYEAYQQQMTQFVNASKHIAVANGETAERFKRRFPDTVIKHSPRSIPPTGSHNTVRASTQRLALIGPLNAQNGYGRVLKLARQLAAQASAIELIVIGTTLNDYPLMATGKVWVTGRLAPEENPAQLAKILGASAALYAPGWPEADDALLDATLKLGLHMVVWPCYEEQTIDFPSPIPDFRITAMPSDWAQHANRLFSLAS